MNDIDLTESRERALIRPPKTFNGIQLHPYSSGRRALFRCLSRKYPDLSGTLLSWALVYCLSLSAEEALVKFSNPELALQETMMFIERNDSVELEEEAIRLVEAIYAEVDAAAVRVSSGNETDPKT